MANVIQIKRGSGAPTANNLADGELGFDKTNNVLYIGKNGTGVVGFIDWNKIAATYLPLSGGTLESNAQIIRQGKGSSWYNGRDAAILRLNPLASGGYCAIISTKTTNGSWEIGSYDKSGSYDKLFFTYITDANYQAQSNTRGQVQFESNGRIISPSLTLTSTTDAGGTADNQPALIIGGTSSGQHIEIDGNEILSKSNATTPDTLYLQDGTGSVSVEGTGGLYVPNGGISKPTTSGSSISYNWISAGGGYGTGSGKNGLKLICCEQSDGTSGIGQDLTGLTYELCIAASESTSNVAYITFAKHKLASPTSYTRLGYFDSSGNFNVSGAITAPSGNISAGTLDNTAAERQVIVQSGAGKIYMFSQASTSGQRGIYIPAHGTGAAKYVIQIDKDNNTSFIGSLSGNASSATSATSAKYLSAASIGSSSTSHATALKNYFDSNKANINRNVLINFYDSSGGNGSIDMGYFLSGYDTGPYGGFFVAHYGSAYYVGIAGGTYTQYNLVTSTSAYRIVYSSSQPSASTGVIWLRPV